MKIDENGFIEGYPAIKHPFAKDVKTLRSHRSLGLSLDEAASGWNWEIIHRRRREILISMGLIIAHEVRQATLHRLHEIAHSVVLKTTRGDL